MDFSVQTSHLLPRMSVKEYALQFTAKYFSFSNYEVSSPYDKCGLTKTQPALS